MKITQKQVVEAIKKHGERVTLIVARPHLAAKRRRFKNGIFEYGIVDADWCNGDWFKSCFMYNYKKDGFTPVKPETAVRKMFRYDKDNDHTITEIRVRKARKK